MSISRIVLVRQPLDLVWDALQNDLPRIAAFIPGIESIQRIETSNSSDGCVCTVHEWKAAAGLPIAIANQADGQALSWTERAEWDRKAGETRWSVESQLLGPALTGSGITRFERAMAGQGTRVSFTVQAQLKGDALGPLGQLKWSGGLATAATAVLAKTLQDLCVAAEAYLKNGSPESPRANAPKQRKRSSK